MKPSVQIGHVSVGNDQPPFFLAELSGNHNGDLGRALEIVDAVAEAGAHALKLQTYTADTMTIDADTPNFRISDGHSLWGSRRLYDLYEEAHTPWEWHEQIFARANERGMQAFSSPFDPTAVQFLEGLGVPAYKVASSEIVDLPLVRAMAETGKPIIISTGMASISEIDAAVGAARQAGNDNIIVLSCTAEYPADPASANLRSLPTLAAAFDTLVGLSDHTMGIGVPVASVAFGACLIEKHVTKRRADGGVDSAFSLEPEEVSALVRETKVAWQALGENRIGAKESEREGLRFRRSLYVTRDVRAGDIAGPENVRSIRPAGGLAPDAFSVIEGRPFTQDAVKGTPLTWDII
ncbi:pseudaminic acid synthase [Nigerium massiliense]|uniref:pseudaminic acid synthase n=1 Tax=Nigerium massiliense TaxID=1522317 RepID=UPI00058BF52D|nr:pseudaminic acid synthase [Nigerium massiliense]